MPFADPLAPDTAAATRWLSIVGIGEDGVDGLSPAARRLVESAEIVFGGKRHLALADPLIRGAARPWRSPFGDAVEEVLACRGRPVCVLASGDPFHYGVGATLMRHLTAEEIMAIPAPSAFSLAAARLGWSLPETTLLSLHGRDPDLIRPHLHPGARILALTSDGDAPAALAGLLGSSGFGGSRLFVLEALGGPRERVRETTASSFKSFEIGPLNTIGIEVVAAADARVISRAAGLPDDLFEHDGQISKREIRALTLSALAPRQGEFLWDVGAGAGSIAIEWMLSHASLSAAAIEQNPERAARIRRNAAALGTPSLHVVEGTAPKAIGNLPRPNAVFVGGGASAPGMLDFVADALLPAGRLVVNAVTLKTEALLIGRHTMLGGDLIRIAVTRSERVGRIRGWRAAMPVTQWSWKKP